MPTSRADTISATAVHHLKTHNLCLTTAESCTAGMIIALLSRIDGSGSVIESGYVVYSVPAKKRLLGVQQSTIDEHTLTSEAVAREMARGALRDSTANFVVATTGIAGDEALDGVPPGTICYAWGYQLDGEIRLLSETVHFSGGRRAISESASHYAIEQLPVRYWQLTREGS